MDCSLLGSSVHGICRARILEWVTTSCSRGSSRPRDRTRGLPKCRQTLLTSEPPGKASFTRSHAGLHHSQHPHPHRPHPPHTNWPPPFPPSQTLNAHILAPPQAHQATLMLLLQSFLGALPRAPPFPATSGTLGVPSHNTITVLWTLLERDRVGRFGRMALKYV